MHAANFFYMRLVNVCLQKYELNIDIVVRKTAFRFILLKLRLTNNASYIFKAGSENMAGYIGINIIQNLEVNARLYILEVNRKDGQL